MRKRKLLHHPKVPPPSPPTPGFIAGMSILGILLLVGIILIILYLVGILNGESGGSTANPVTPRPIIFPRPSIFVYLTKPALSNVGGFAGLQAKCTEDFPSDLLTGTPTNITPLMLDPSHTDLNELMPAPYRGYQMFGEGATTAVPLQSSWNAFISSKSVTATWGTGLRFPGPAEGSMNQSLAWSNIGIAMNMRPSNESCDYYDLMPSTGGAISSGTIQATATTFGGPLAACIVGSPGSQAGLPYLCAATLLDPLV